MRTPDKSHSPLGILTELAVEGTSSLVEAQRALLSLAQQENDIILNGVKERIGGFIPAVAMTDLVRRSFDTFIGMHQELLTTTSKQTLRWLEADKSRKDDRTARLVDFAREGVEVFTRAQKKFLDAVAQESARVSSGKHDHVDQSAKKHELKELALEVSNAFIEAQKRLLDVMGQQANVNLDSATKALGMISASRLQPLANLTTQGVKSFVDAETSMVASMITSRKKAAGRAKPHGKRKVHAKAATA